MVPLFQELSVSLAALEARSGHPDAAAADPYLFRHLAGQLDSAMLELLAEDDLSRRRRLNLNLPRIIVAGVRRRSHAAARPVRLGVEIPFMEAVADLPRFAEPRALQRDGLHRGAGRPRPCRCLLHATRPRWQPDMLKLDWSPRMAALPGASAGCWPKPSTRSAPTGSCCTGRKPRRRSPGA